jgi:hypothetical protein
VRPKYRTSIVNLPRRTYGGVVIRARLITVLYVLIGMLLSTTSYRLKSSHEDCLVCFDQAEHLFGTALFVSVFLHATSQIYSAFTDQVPIAQAYANQGFGPSPSKPRSIK